MFYDRKAEDLTNDELIRSVTEIKSHAALRFDCVAELAERYEALLAVVGVELECNSCGDFPIRNDLMKSSNRAGDQCPASYLDRYDCDGTLIPIISIIECTQAVIMDSDGKALASVSSVANDGKAVIVEAVVSQSYAFDEPRIAWRAKNGVIPTRSPERSSHPDR